VISPVAELIKARNRPFIFATGYGSSGVPEQYRRPPRAAKALPARNPARIIDTALKSHDGLDYYQTRLTRRPDERPGDWRVTSALPSALRKLVVGADRAATASLKRSAAARRPDRCLPRTSFARGVPNQ